LRPLAGRIVVVVFVMTDDDNDTFAAACARADAKKATQPAKADDWLAIFAAKSNAELAKKAAENNIPPPPKAEEVIATLASKPAEEYDQVRGSVAETLGIRVGTLDERVQATRVELATDKPGPAHWAVKPASEPVDGAVLLDDLRSTLRRYIMLPPGGDVAIALWILHAWTHDSCEISPILCLDHRLSGAAKPRS
jgi:hypothetical protein